MDRSGPSRGRGWLSVRDIARSGKQLVHVGHAVEIPRPIATLSRALIEAPHEWFPRTVGVHIGAVPVRKRVVVEFGEAVRTSTWAVIRVNWRATFPQRLFPTMEGKVSLSPAGKTASKLTISGVYLPPLGHFGEDLNEAGLHAIAERTVQELAQAVARRLQKAADSSR